MNDNGPVLRNRRERTDRPIRPRSPWRFGLIFAAGFALVAGMVAFVESAKPIKSPVSAKPLTLLPSPPRMRADLIRHVQGVELCIYAAPSSAEQGVVTLYVISGGATIQTGYFSVKSPVQAYGGVDLLFGASDEFSVDVFAVKDNAISQLRVSAGRNTLDETTPTVIDGVRVAALLFRVKQGETPMLHELGVHGALIGRPIPT